MNRLNCAFIFLLLCSVLNAQQEIELSFFLKQLPLTNVNHLLIQAEVDIAQKELSSFSAEQKPNITANIQVLDFYNASRAIIQPTGAIDFLNIRQNTSDFFIEGSYNSILTGGTLFVQSNLKRFDDFSFDISQYNSVPFRIGVIQPIFGHNAMKWEKRTKKLNLESIKQSSGNKIKYLESRVVDYFFEVVNTYELYQNSIKNEESANFLYSQYGDRMELGTGDIEDFMFLELELESSRLNKERALQNFLLAEENLWIFVGISKPSDMISYVYPNIDILSDIEVSKAVELFLQNSPARIIFETEVLQVEREIDEVLKTNGIRGNLLASYGLTKSSNAIDDLLNSPLKENQINIKVTIPVYDWGRKSKKVELLKIKMQEKQLIHQSLDLDNRIKFNATLSLFQTAKNNIQRLQNITQISSERYQKVYSKYRLGDMETLELIQATRDLDMLRLELVKNKKVYWVALFDINYQTGYSYSNQFYPQLR